MIVGFIHALTKQLSFLRSRNLDFKLAMSIHGLALKRLFHLKEETSQIFMFGQRHKELYHLVRDNIRGGLAIVYNRMQIAGETVIKREYYGADALVTRSVVGYDIRLVNPSIISLQI